MITKKTPKKIIVPLRPRPSTRQATGVWQSRAFDNHEFVMTLSDKASGLKAYIGIHNTNRGPALGGTRFKAYGSDAEALEDVLNLSRAMSYKCALANLSFGGGKGVIIANNVTDRDRLLTAYARLVDKLGGLFKTGTDVGIGDLDVRHMGRQTSHMLGVVPADRGDLSTSASAALGVFYAMKAALTHLYGNADFDGRKVAIKGAGKLGGELARLVREAGGEVRISDINPQQCSDIRQRYPDIQIVDNAEIHKQEVDIYAPCALGNEFTVETVRELKCRSVTGGANNQLADEAAGDLLNERQILYTPDYIANAGGLIYVADELEPGGFSVQRVLARTADIEKTVTDIFNLASKEKLPTYAVADQLARARIEEAGPHGE